MCCCLGFLRLYTFLGQRCGVHDRLGKAFAEVVRNSLNGGFCIDDGFCIEVDLYWRWICIVGIMLRFEDGSLSFGTMEMMMVNTRGSMCPNLI